jgi:cytochrome c-type biogenesis protein CcmH
MRVCITLAAALVFGAAAIANADEVVTIDDPELNARYQAMIQEVRCLVCESRSIAESPAEVAQELKRVIRDMVLEGRSNDEIADFLVERYGDSILYRPPIQPNTWLLWGGPVALLGLGAAVFARIVRRRAREPIDFDDDLEDESADWERPSSRDVRETGGGQRP